MSNSANFPDVFFLGDAKIGLPKEARVLALRSDTGKFPDRNLLEHETSPVSIGVGSMIGNGVTVYEVTQIGCGVIVEDHSRIGFDCKLGDGVRLMYGAYVCDRVQIGSHSRIAGFVCDAARIGINCSVMGRLVHKYAVPDLEWGIVDEISPTIADNVIVGVGATIVGGVEIGWGSYVAAGAVVTRSVPRETVVTGSNIQTSAGDWPGRELRDFFDRRRAKSNG